MEQIAHLPFIIASYLAAFAVIGVLIGWVVLDYRAQKRAIDDLEAKGVTRRSTPARSERMLGRAEEPT